MSSQGRLIKNGQRHARLNHEGQFRDMQERFDNQGYWAWFESDYKWKVRSGMARLLKDRVNVDPRPAQNLGERRYDSGLVFNNETEIMSASEISADWYFLNALFLQSHAVYLARAQYGNQIRNYCDRGRMPAGPMPCKHRLSSELACGHHQVLPPLDTRKGRRTMHQHWFHGGQQLSIRLFRARNLADGRIE